MYQLVTLKDSVRIPPHSFSAKLNESALQILREKYERTVHPKLGIIVALQNPEITSSGKIVQGDGAAYFEIQFEALAFNLEINEIVEGWVSQVVEFGAFARLGPIDGLVHVSQITTEFMTFDSKTQKLTTENGKFFVGVDDVIKAKVSTVSVKESIPSSKIALTMRPEGLGKEGMSKPTAGSGGRRKDGSGGKRREKR